MRILHYSRAAVLTGLLVALFTASCGSSTVPEASPTFTEKHFEAVDANGRSFTLWLTESTGPDGRHQRSISLRDPEEQTLLFGSSTSTALDSLSADLQAEGSGPHRLRGVFAADGGIHLSYRKANAMQEVGLVFKETPDGLVITPQNLSRTIKATREPTPMDEGGFEEMELDQMDRTAELRVLRIDRSDGTRHSLDSLLEAIICEGTMHYDAFMDAQLSSHSWYELSVSVVDRSKDLIAFRIFQHVQDPGAVHGQFGSRYVNFDLGTTRTIGLWDIVDRRKRAKLKALCSKAFYKKYPETSPKHYPFKLSENVAVLSTGLLFHYQPYEMGYFAEGEKDVFLPYTAIAELLDKSNELVLRLTSSVQ
jgi:hypothetical protein